MSDPKTHRTVLTKAGVESIPRSQVGVPFSEYFQNVRLPQDPRHAVVFVTENGPVLDHPDPVPWSEEHDRKQTATVARIKDAIETQGRYKPVLDGASSDLARETGLRVNEVRDRIIGEFTATHGKDVRSYLEDQREAQGLPTRRTQPVYGAQAAGMAQDFEPEL